MSTTTKKRITNASLNGNGASVERESKQERLPVLKTYKIYIGGKFPRTESGRYYQPLSPAGKPLANVGHSSRKDIRDAVGAARSAFGGWAGRSAYNRSQILYRIAEMLEGRSAQFIQELMLHGASLEDAETEVAASVDRWIHFAGWCDKYQQIFSSVNPVASSHFNFSIVEPTGVVGIIAPKSTGLIGLTAVLAPIIAGGNTVVLVASEDLPLPAVTLSEVLATSDLPGGVVNILTGRRDELIKPMVQHMDVNAVVIADVTLEERTLVQQEAVANLKRCIFHEEKDWMAESAGDPYMILAAQEVKTTWHPIEKGQGGGGGY